MLRQCLTHKFEPEPKGALDHMIAYASLWFCLRSSTTAHASLGVRYTASTWYHSEFPMPHTHSFFESRQKPLALVAALYVLFLVLSHWQLPPVHVWIIAAFFSIVMNFTYVTEALKQPKHIKVEALIATLLITASILGVFVAPIFVIAAIFGHGVWNIAKHRGAGVPFFSWYTLSCFTIDTLYSVSLLAYWVQVS